MKIISTFVSFGLFLLKSMKNITTHHFTWVLKRVSLLWPSPWQPRPLFPNCSFASEGATPELDWGCFDPPACPNRQLCTWGTGRALEPRSHLATIVCPGGPGRPVSLPPPSLPLSLCLARLLLLFSNSFARSLTLRLSPSPLSVFCSTGTCGPTEALGYTKKRKLSFICSLLPAVHFVHLCSLSAQKMYRFYPWLCYRYWQ